MEQDKLIETVKRAKNGDSAAMGELYEQTSKMVYFNALKFTGNEADAQDVTQDVFVTVITKLSGLKDEQTFPKWLKTITVNNCKNFCKKKKPMLFSTDEEEEQAIGGIEELSEDFLPEVCADRQEGSRIIMDIIDRLPEKQKLTVIMFYFDEMSIAEIAKEFETSENTVKSRLNYARAKIKEEVELTEREQNIRLHALPVPMSWLMFDMINIGMESSVVPQGIFTGATAAAKAAVPSASAAAASAGKAGAAAGKTASSAAAKAVKIALGAVGSAAVIGSGTAFFALNGKQSANPIVSDRFDPAEIVEEWYDTAVEEIRNGDIKAFSELYDSSYDGSVIVNDYSYLKDIFFGDEIYSIDTTFILSDEDEIIFDTLFYYNYKNEKGDDSSKYSTNIGQKLRLENDGWKICSELSEEAGEEYTRAKERLYGSKAYYSGFCSADYQMITGKAFLSGVNVNCKSAFLNEDGSLTVNVGIANGYREDKVLTELSGTVGYGKDGDSLLDAIDFSRPFESDKNIYGLYLPAKKVTYITVTAAPDDLLAPFSSGAKSFNNQKTDFSCSYINAESFYKESSASIAETAEQAAAAENEVFSPASGNSRMSIMEEKVTVSVLSVDKDAGTVTIRIENGRDKEISTFGLPIFISGDASYQTDVSKGNNGNISVVRISSGTYSDITYYVDASLLIPDAYLEGELFTMDPSVDDRTYRVALN